MPARYENQHDRDVIVFNFNFDDFQEKKRIMLRMKPPGHENAIIDNYVPIYRPGEYKIRKTEDLDLSKIL